MGNPTTTTPEKAQGTGTQMSGKFNYANTNVDKGTPRDQPGGD